MLEIIDLTECHRQDIASPVSPEFRAPSPKIVNEELIPQHCYDVMSLSWHKDVFPSENLTITMLFDVYVTMEGLVFDHNKKLISQTITQHSIQEQDIGFQKINNSNLITQIEIPSLLLRKRGDGNYGHWMVEILPKLCLALKYCDVEGLAIPFEYGLMNKIIYDSILRLKSKTFKPQIFPLIKEGVYFFKQLIIVDGLSRHGTFMSPLALEPYESARSKFNVFSNRKIYITRRRTPRTLVNDDQVEQAFQKQGFIIVDPTSMTLSEQIAVFSNAKVIMGVMGAGLTNMIFAKSGAQVVNLAPATMPDTFFYFLSVHKKHSYSEIRGETVSNSLEWDQKFNVSLDQIMAEIA